MKYPYMKDLRRIRHSSCSRQSKQSDFCFALEEYGTRHVMDKPTAAAGKGEEGLLKKKKNIQTAD
ncbi:hypothetical protein C0J52_04020 [Blattella germanica]|nr:hypothetical protein C0J52_04020 [Blattella germanica]